jgi:hypothetical protein
MAETEISLPDSQAAELYTELRFLRTSFCKILFEFLKFAQELYIPGIKTGLVCALILRYH